jgi:hypothetical protein
MDRFLDSAIDALRESERDAASCGLSDVTRAKIVQAAWAEATDRAETSHSVFQPMRWLAVAGVVPVVLMVIASILPLPREGAVSRRGPAFVGAQKVGDDVVFTIVDGRARHSVVKSTDPARFNHGASQSVNKGRYLDRVNSGPVVVYYRID